MTKAHFFVTRLCLYLVTFAILSTQMACAMVPVEMPAYVVMLTNYYPGLDSRCTGVALDYKHVLTAAHCLDSVQRVIAPDGQEAVIVAAEYAAHDMALVELNRPLFLSKFAVLGEPQKGVPAQIYGTCPYYWGHMPRQAMYSGMWSVEVRPGLWIDFDVWTTLGDTSAVCGGDSGGVVISEGKVVGIISAVESRYYFVAYGQTFYTVPATLAERLRVLEQ